MVSSEQGGHIKESQKTHSLSSPFKTNISAAMDSSNSASKKGGMLDHMEGTDDWSIPAKIKDHPFFVEVKDGSMVDALVQLNEKLQAKGERHIITHKPLRPILGQTVEAGQIGIYSRNGRPVVAINAGQYWNLSLVHEWQKTHLINEQLEFMGLTMAQVGQGDCLVVQAPNNNIFVLRNSGFVAYGSEGRFRIIDVVDTLNLGPESEIHEQSTNILLGWKKDVKTMITSAEGRKVSVTVATFFNVPASSVLVVQQADKLLVLNAGQHVITNPTTTYRGFYSLAERQKTFHTKPAYTVEGVPVVLNVNLRYRLASPLLLALHYSEPFAALENPAQSAVNAVVSRMSYNQFMRAKNMGGDIPDHDHMSWLEMFKQECMAELTSQAQSYGIVVESFNVLDRDLDGDLGRDLQKQADMVLQNQIRSTQIALENNMKLETEKGKLRVAEVEAEQQRTRTDAQFYSSVKVAEAETQASGMRAKQDAENIRMLALAKSHEVQLMADAYKEINNDQAVKILMAELDIKKTNAFPQNTVYFASAGTGPVDQSYMAGFGSALGVNLAQKKPVSKPEN